MAWIKLQKGKKDTFLGSLRKNEVLFNLRSMYGYNDEQWLWEKFAQRGPGMVANDYEREICDGVLCGLSLLLVLALSWPCSEGFSPGHSGPPPPPKKANISKFQLDLEW